jgi:hypothetical protein
MTRASALFACAVALTGSALSLAFVTPIASADTLSNGLTVTCSPVGPNQLTCVIGGCPRVNGDYVVDALHVMDNGYQFPDDEFKCINGQTVTHNVAVIVSGIGPGGYTLGFQACRKKDLESDWCGPWANYTWKPPAQPAAPPAPPAPPANVQCSDGSSVPAGQTCPVKPAVDTCPDGSTVPHGQACPVPVVTNAIKLSFGNPGFGSITATISNSSDLPGKCTYDATGLADTHRDFNVPAKGSTNLTFNGFNTGTTYHATVSCNDASGKQTQPIGSDSKDVKF